MIEEQELRAFAQRFIDESDREVDKCGSIGAHIEVARAEVARALLALLDSIRARQA